MYRIRLASGEEAVYRTAEELAQAVSSGVVSATAEVFHKSADRWLPIDTHPDYRAVVTVKHVACAPASEPGPAASHPTQGFHDPSRALPPEAPAPTVGPSPGPAPARSSAPAIRVMQEPVPEIQSSPSSLPAEATRAGKLRVVLALAMGVAALGLIAGGAVLAWPTASTWLATHRGRGATMSEGMPPLTPIPPPSPAEPPPAARAPESPLTGRLDSLAEAYPAPSRPLAAASAESDTFPARAPDATRVSRFTATRTKLPTYFEAYADARSEMDDGFDYVSFRRVFAPSRFAAPESLRAARRVVAAAGNILRVYRGREVMLEQTYRPDDPGGRGSLREPFETAEASRALLADVDSLFGLLVSQQGRFSYTNASVHFQDPRAARGYSQLRAEIVATLAGWRDSSGAANRVTFPRLLQALGGALPPPAR